MYELKRRVLRALVRWSKDKPILLNRIFAALACVCVLALLISVSMYRLNAWQHGGGTATGIGLCGVERACSAERSVPLTPWEVAHGRTKGHVLLQTVQATSEEVMRTYNVSCLASASIGFPHRMLSLVYQGGEVEHYVNPQIAYDSKQLVRVMETLITAPDDAGKWVDRAQALTLDGLRAPKYAPQEVELRHDMAMCVHSAIAIMDNE
jgi:hypothetical protein